VKFIDAKSIKFEYTRYDEEKDISIPVCALNGVDLSVEKGDFIAILGHNGSGKSTLAKILNGLLLPKEGTVVVSGEMLKDEKSIWTARTKLGMVFQNPDNQIIASVVEEDVAFGPENLGFSPEKIKENISFALDAVGMNDYRYATPSNLSGGQKQRIAIAGVLAMKPECIVFDESTAMLDPIGRKDVIKVASYLNREHGMTVIMITHFMDEAAKANKIFVMNEGVIVKSGTPSEIFSDVEYMRGLRLDVPIASEIVYELNTAFNKKIPSGIVTSEALVRYILSQKPPKNVNFEQREHRSVHNEPILQVKGLTHIYGEKTAFERVALKDINIEIYSGEFVGIIGHTGSGKSTLTQHLNALITSEKGEVLFKGENILKDKENIKKIRQKIGLVFQYPENQLFEENVYDEIAFGPKNMGIDEEEIKKRVASSLKMVELDESYCKKSPFSLSGGQKRRVAIASVLAMKPEILVLDEPMAGLDPMGRRAILSNIRKMRDELGITILLVSHSMEDVSEVCDRILVMNEGKVEMLDTVYNVFKNVNRLKQIGLDAPEVSLIMHELRQEGINVPDDVYSVRDAADIIGRLLNGE